MTSELGQDINGPGEQVKISGLVSDQAHEQIVFTSASAFEPTYALVFQSSVSGDYLFQIKTDGSVELGSGATLDQASKAFWDFILQECPFVGAVKKQEVRNWLQRKRAMDSRDLHAVELLNELEQVLEA